MSKKRSGFIVETKSGKVGKIYSNEKFIDGKIVVFSDQTERPMLCSPDTLKIVSRFD